MCSACEDISSQMDFSQETKCSWSIQLPSGVNLTLEANERMTLWPNFSNITYSFAPFPYATNIMYWSNVTSIDDGTATLPDNATTCSAFINAIETMALNCTLYPCVRTYSTSVTSGQTSERLISTTNMTLSGSSFHSAAYALCPCHV